jgi:hypothetical protein
MWRIIQYRQNHINCASEWEMQDQNLLLATLNLTPRISFTIAIFKEVVINLPEDQQLWYLTDFFESDDFLYDGFLYKLKLLKTCDEQVCFELEVKSAIPRFESVDPNLIQLEKYNSFPPCINSREILIRIYNFWHSEYDDIKNDNSTNDDLVLIPIENSCPIISSFPFKEYSSLIPAINWDELFISPYVHNNENIIKFQVVHSYPE